MYADPELSARARTFIQLADRESLQIGISVVSLAEIVYLVEKGRVRPTAFDDIRRALADPKHVFHALPLTVEIADAMRRIPRRSIPDFPDRAIAATALQSGIPAITRDGRIRASDVDTIW